MIEDQLHQKFEELYAKKLRPKIILLEHERISISNSADKNVLMVILIMSFTMIVFWVWENLYIIVPCIVFAIIFASKFSTANNKKKTEFRLKLKQQILMEIFSLFGTFMYCPNSDLITINEIRKTGLFPKCNHKRDDDKIIGKYKGMNIMIVETSLFHNESLVGKSSEPVIDFNGLIIRTILNKPYKGKTILCQKEVSQKDQKQVIKSFILEHAENAEQAEQMANSKIIDNLINMQIFFDKYSLNNIDVSLPLNNTNKKIRVDGNLQKVTLEDLEFNQMYDIYSDDQVEARYILTPTFMERLKNIREVIGGFDVHCVVENKFLTLFIQVPKNFFEISNDITCSIDNQKNYENIFIQLVSIFNLIHYFKLDKKLGL